MMCAGLLRYCQTTLETWAIVSRYRASDDSTFITGVNKNIIAFLGKRTIPGCAKPLVGPKLVQITHKGYARLLKVSQRRGDNIFNLPDIHTKGLFVHEKCRRVYTSETNINDGRQLVTFSVGSSCCQIFFSKIRISLIFFRVVQEFIRIFSPYTDFVKIFFPV